jgi:hypothetical protein
MLTQGIGNNVVLDNILFTGKNNGIGLPRIFLFSLPQNVSITNLKFIDFIWPGDSYGKIPLNFVDTSCPEKSKIRVLIENNIFINSNQNESGNVPFHIFNIFSNPNLEIKMIFRGNTFIN